MLSACSSSRLAISKFRNDFNFSQVSSYSFYDRNSDFSDFQNISDAMRNSIELAIEQVLDKNGFEYQQPKNADIVVAYHLVNKNAKELNDYNKGVGYCSYCLRGGEAQKNKKPWQIMPGSLILDIVSSKSQQSIWRSVYNLNIHQKKDNSKEAQLKIYQAIDAMMRKFPSSKKANTYNLAANRA
jgi:hypothetical protein